MIHCFTCNGTHLLLDADSGAVHIVDALVKALIPYFAEKDFDKALVAVKGVYTQEEAAEAWDELLELEKAGALNTDYAYGDEFGKPAGVIKALCLNVSHDCNLRCGYCFAGTGDFGTGRLLMPLETACAAIDFLIEKSGGRQHLEVDLFGGEPLMNWDVVAGTVAYGRAREKETGKSIRFTITTNALALDDGKCAFINEEMANVVLSLDGRKDVHDALRKTPAGTGSYDLVVDRAKKLARMRGGREHYVRGTYTALNTDFARDVLALSDLGFEQISLEPVVTKDRRYALSGDDMPRIRVEYEKLARIYVQRRKNGKWLNFFHFMLDLTDAPCISKRLLGCGAGNEYVAVTPEGDIYPCHQFVGETDFKMGNVHAGTFDHVMQQRFAKMDILHNNACRKCWAKYFCCGGCRANAWKMNGDLQKPHEMSCDIFKAHLECALWVHAYEKAYSESDQYADSIYMNEGGASHG
ncbi:MAG: thioether cross-link-forming SCIFF peptide maturase [Bacillota bacterium]